MEECLDVDRHLQLCIARNIAYRQQGAAMMKLKLCDDEGQDQCVESERGCSCPRRTVDSQGSWRGSRPEGCVHPARA